jgi:hypothetical protein
VDGAKTPVHEAHPANDLFLRSQGREPKKGRAAASNEATSLNPEKRHFVTAVVSEYTVKRCHHRVLFGEPVRRVLLARSRGHIRVRHEFVEHSRFVLDLWRRNQYGTLQWRCYVCVSGSPGERLESVPFVSPGARVLLATRGAAQSKAFLAWLYDLQRRGVDPLRCASETFEAVHFRLRGRRAGQWHINALNGVL